MNRSQEYLGLNCDAPMESTGSTGSIGIGDCIGRIVILNEKVENSRGAKFNKNARYKVRSVHLGRLILQDKDATHMCSVMPDDVTVLA